MKPTYILILAGALTLAACKPEEKRESQPAAAAAADTAKAPETVAEALDEIVTINGTPSRDAEYYVYLQSASWCPPCRAEMPEIVKAYPEMKENGVELILVGCDETLPGTQQFIESFGATFPATHYQDEGLKKLPGYTPAKGIPDAIFADKNGTVLAHGHGALVKHWRQVLHKEQPAAEPSAPQPASQEAESASAAESEAVSEAAVPSL